MITEDYVSFEVAKLLKEKGFDAKCRYVWKLDKSNNPQDTDGISKVCAERFMEGESFVDNSDIKKVFEYEGWFEGCHKVYLCPTLQMTMKWLREVHKLDIDVSIEYKNSKKVYYYSVLKKTIIRDIDCLHSETNFNSYEEACEAAIKYCLENLI